MNSDEINDEKFNEIIDKIDLFTADRSLIKKGTEEEELNLRHHWIWMMYKALEEMDLLRIYDYQIKKLYKKIEDDVIPNLEPQIYNKFVISGLQNFIAYFEDKKEIEYLKLHNKSLLGDKKDWDAEREKFKTKKSELAGTILELMEKLKNEAQDNRVKLTELANALGDVENGE